MENYPLWFDNKQVGNVTVQKRGLYYHFDCTCNMPTDIDFRVQVHCGEIITDLGICVPEAGSYILRKQIPTKHIGEGMLQFYIGNNNQCDDNLIPIYTDTPFAGIVSLENAKLMIRNDKHYIYWD